MNNQSILVTIQNSINQLKELTPLQKQKAINLSNSVFNLYRIKGNLYSDYLSLSRNFFITYLKSRDYYIKRILVANSILESDNSYNVDKGIGKGYRFNRKFFTELNVSSTITTFTYSTTNSFSTKSPISYLCSHTGDTHQHYDSKTHFLYNYYQSIFARLTFDEDVDSFINDLSKISTQNLTIDDKITDDYIYLTLQKEKYRYSRPKALELARNTGNSLIQYKDKFYLDQPDRFKENKSNQLKISYCQSVFNIKNNLFYCDRNDTNNRLDHNLTGLKKELFTKLRFDGEKLIELDIANAQFAIAAHLNTTIDANFIDHASRGSLYSYIAKELNIDKEIDQKAATKKAKNLMFRVAFDRIKSDFEFNQIRALFPKYMNWVDSYKKDNGYKLFSNLLQKKEAEIMIDGLLMHIIDKGYDVFTVHDALRVKQSEVDKIQCIMKSYFSLIGFECLVRSDKDNN